MKPTSLAVSQQDPPLVRLFLMWPLIDWACQAVLSNGRDITALRAERDAARAGLIAALTSGPYASEQEATAAQEHCRKLSEQPIRDDGPTTALLNVLFSPTERGGRSFQPPAPQAIVLSQKADLLLANEIVPMLKDANDVMALETARLLRRTLDATAREVEVLSFAIKMPNSIVSLAELASLHKQLDAGFHYFRVLAGEQFRPLANPKWPDPISVKMLASNIGYADADYVGRKLRVAAKAANIAAPTRKNGVRASWKHSQIRTASGHLPEEMRAALKMSGFPNLNKPE